MLILKPNVACTSNILMFSDTVVLTVLRTVLVAGLYFGIALVHQMNINSATDMRYNHEQASNERNLALLWVISYFCNVN